MRKILTLSLSLAAFIANAASPVKIISGRITTNTTWSPDTIYVLSQRVYVDPGATLTILPGTIIKGDTSKPDPANPATELRAGTLVITRGAKLVAEGTPTKPIVFTSIKAPGLRKQGDWAGVAIAGNAKLNTATGTAPFEGGFLASSAGNSDGEYGGLNDVDNSGILKYVRIEYAGYIFNPNNELNSLTCGGVGSGTQLDFIQTSFGQDDGFEFFGGTVNAKHLISFSNQDDDYDTDFGFSGMMQYLLAIRNPNMSDVSQSNAIESDNDNPSGGQGSYNNPRTFPKISNMTIIGPQTTTGATVDPNFKRAIHIRRNSRFLLANSFFAGYPTGIKIDGNFTQNQVDSGITKVINNVFAGYTTLGDSTSTTTSWGITSYLTNTANTNSFLANTGDAMLTSPFYSTTPSAIPFVGSPLLTGANFTDAILTNSFYNKVNFKGAFGSDNWSTGWANFNPQNEAYEYGYGVVPAGINGVAQLNWNINVYPVPATSVISINFATEQSAEVDIQLLNTTGQVLRTIKSKGTQHNHQINIANLADGIYFISFVTEEGVQYKRIQVGK
jgi:hypothetical protein